MRHRCVIAITAAASALLGAGPLSAASAIQASVDANGQVVLGAPSGAQSEPATRSPAALCPEAALLPLDTAKAIVIRVANEEGFFPDFVMSVAKIESHYKTTSLSDKGAFGLMQLMPETARRFRVDLCDPADNVRGGIRLLRTLHERYRNPFFILAAYNAGEEALLKAKGVPPFPETVRFVADVINDFYAWPATAPRARGRDAMAAMTMPGIVEVAPAPDTSAPSPPPTAASPWSAGFVMHVD